MGLDGSLHSGPLSHHQNFANLYVLAIEDVFWGMRILWGRAPSLLLTHRGSLGPL